MTVNLYPLDEAWFEIDKSYLVILLSSFQNTSVYVPVKPKLFWEVNCIGQGNCKEFVGFYLSLFFLIALS